MSIDKVSFENNEDMTNFSYNSFKYNEDVSNDENKTIEG